MVISHTAMCGCCCELPTLLEERDRLHAEVESLRQAASARPAVYDERDAELDRLRAENEKLNEECVWHQNKHALAVNARDNAQRKRDRYRDALRELVEALDCEDNNRGDVRDRALDRARELVKEASRG